MAQCVVGRMAVGDDHFKMLGIVVLLQQLMQRIGDERRLVAHRHDHRDKRSRGTRCFGATMTLLFENFLTHRMQSFSRLIGRICNPSAKRTDGKSVLQSECETNFSLGTTTNARNGDVIEYIAHGFFHHRPPGRPSSLPPMPNGRPKA